MFVNRVCKQLCNPSRFATLVLAEIVKWVAIAILLIGVTIAINTLFPQIRGHIAIGVAAGFLLFVIYGVQSLRD